MGAWKKRSRRRRLTAGIPVVVLELALVCLLLPAPPAAQATSALQYFTQQGCPVRYRAEATSRYSTAEKASYRRALHDWKFADAAQMRIRPPFDWTRGRSRAIRSKIHQMKYLDRLIGIFDRRRIPTTMAFIPADEDKAFRHAIALAVDWARAARARRVPRADAWKQRVTGIRAPYLAYVARRAACAGRLSEREARPIRLVMRRHARVLRKPAAISTPVNHKLSINFGLAALGTYFPKDPVIKAAARRARPRFARALRAGYQPAEGVWLEQSPRYHLLAYRVARSFLHKFAPYSDAIRRIAYRLRGSLARLLMPDDRLVTFGDTSGNLIQDGRITGSRRNGWWVARRSGYAVYGSPKRWFGITAQYHQRQHKQADELSFDLYESGRRLIQDTGFFHRDNSAWGRYQASSRAHSVLTVDGRDFDWKLHKRPYGSGVLASGTGDGWYAVRAENPLLVAPRKLTKAQRNHSIAYKQNARQRIRAAQRYNAQHTRTYLYKPGEALIVADSVRSATPHVYRRHFQFAPGVSVNPAGDLLHFRSRGLEGKLLTASSVPVGWINLRRGENDPVLGYAFPNAGKRVARTVAVLGTAAEDLDQVSGLFYGGPPVTGLAFEGTLQGTQTLVLRGENGRPRTSLTVTRDGSSLSVRERRGPGGLLGGLPLPFGP